MPHNYSLIANGFFPQGAMPIQLTIMNSNNDYGIIYPKLISMGQWEIGLKTDNNDLFQYPSGFPIDIMLDGISDDQFINIMVDLQTLETRCFVQNFSGYVYIAESSVTVDFRKKIISLKVVDAFVDLKKVDPRTNPFGYDLDAKVLLNDLILDMLRKSSIIYHPGAVVNLCSYEARCGEGAYYPVSAWGMTYGFYFGEHATYGTVLEVLKSILNALGCKGYIGFDTNFYIVPRFYNNNLPVKTIPDENVSEKIEIDVIRKMQGIQVFLNNGSPGVYVETSVGSVVKKGGDLLSPDIVEVMKFDQPVGDIPGGGVSNLFVTNGVAWGVADMNHCRRKQADGTYTADKSLWRLTTDDAWSIIQNDRPLFKFQVYPNKVNGYSTLLNYLSIGDFFKRSLMPSKVLHARWLGYNWNTDYIDVECME